MSKILVVDDEQDMVTWLTTFFEDNGFETVVAYNGVEAFEKAKSEKPDLPCPMTITVAPARGVWSWKSLILPERVALHC